MAPFGLAFLTLQICGALIDIKRKGKFAASFLDFSLFVAFFPQLVAGPISRSCELLPQIQSQRFCNSREIPKAVLLILSGMAMKAIFADSLAPFFSAFAKQKAATDVLTVIFMSYLGIATTYADFGGYSLIALGSAKLLGFEISKNFRAPLSAANPSEFWRRWHISLTSWVRDYLYVPVAVRLQTWNVPPTMAKMLALTVAFLFIGFWHGGHAQHFVWGILQVGIIVVYRLSCGFFCKRNVVHTSLRMIGSILALTSIALAGWFLLVDNIDAALRLLSGLGKLSSQYTFNKVQLLCMGTLTGMIFCLDGSAATIRRCFKMKVSGYSLELPIQYALIAILTTAILVFGSPVAQEFIYLQVGH